MFSLSSPCTLWTSRSELLGSAGKRNSMLTVFFSKKVLATVLISAVVGGVGVWSGTVAFSTAAPPSPPLSGPSSASKSGVEALAGGPSAIGQGTPQGDVTVARQSGEEGKLE